MLLALSKLVVRDDEQLALVRLERVDAEGVDAEESTHVVRLPVVVGELPACISPPLENVRRTLGQRPFVVGCGKSR